jgi:hypothetical protein
VLHVAGDVDAGDLVLVALGEGQNVGSDWCSDTGRVVLI